MSPHTKNFILSLAATAIWFFIMRPFTPPNIVAFELAGSVDAAQNILSVWGPELTSKVKTGIYLDFGFILVYCSAFMFACRASANYSGVPFFINITKQLIVASWIAGLCDVIENIALLKTLSQISQTSVSIAFYFATIKFSILLIASTFTLICVVTGLFTKLRS
jgi:hypothetical protein